MSDEIAQRKCSQMVNDMKHPFALGSPKWEALSQWQNPCKGSAKNQESVDGASCA